MAWIRTTEVAAGRRAKIDFRLGRVLTRVFQVEFTNKDADPFEAMFAPGIPEIRSPYEGTYAHDFGTLLQSIDPDQDAKYPFRWFVKCEYASIPLDLQRQPLEPGQLSDNPLLERPKKQFGATHDTKVMDREADPGNINNYQPRPILNSAKQPFQPRPVVDRSRQSLTYQRNEVSQNMNYYTDFWDTVNENDFLGYDPGLVKCSYIIQHEDFRNGIPFWVTTFHFEFRQRQCPQESIAGGQPEALKGLGWDMYPVDMGTRIIDGNGNFRPIVNGLAMGLQPLDGAGRQLYLPNQAARPPVHLAFFAYPRKDFSVLEIRL